MTNPTIIVNYQPFAANSTATIVKGNIQYKVPLPNDTLIDSLYAYCRSEKAQEVLIAPGCPKCFIEKFAEEIESKEHQDGLIGEFDKITIRSFENEVSD